MHRRTDIPKDVTADLDRWPFVLHRSTMRGLRCAAMEIAEAGHEHIPEMITLEASLFAEDAGTYDTYVNLDWPNEYGADDFATLVDSDRAIVLAVIDNGSVVGFLAGYDSDASPTRQPVRYATLRSMYVAPHARDNGAGTALVKAFIDWARQQGCVEAHVDAYTDNDGAQRFYERHGFTTRSISRARTL